MKNNHLHFLKFLTTNKPSRPLKIGTDCSGIEAPLIALQLLNIPYIHVFRSEIDEICNSIFKLNFNSKNVILYNDLFNRTSIPNIDVYICGFPCQSFSLNGRYREGFDTIDNQGIIFFKCFEVIKNTKPIFFILENVKGLISHNKGETFSIILKYLHSLSDYNIYYQVLNTKDYCIPQNRPRIYIVGIKKKNQIKNFIFPNPINNCNNIMTILDKNCNCSSNKPNIYCNILTPHKKNILTDHHINTNENYFVNLNVSSISRSAAMKNIVPCLVTGHSYYSTLLKRDLIPRELLRLQAFPDEFNIDGLSKAKAYKITGNTMSVNVLAFLFNQILKTIKI